MPGVQNIDQGKKLEISFANEDLHFSTSMGTEPHDKLLQILF